MSVVDAEAVLRGQRIIAVYTPGSEAEAVSVADRTQKKPIKFAAAKPRRFPWRARCCKAASARSK